MTADNFTEAARESAASKYQGDWDAFEGDPVDDWGFSEAERRAYVAGAEWARAHLAAQDVAAVRALVHYATCRHVGDDAEAAQEPTDADMPENVADLIRDLTDPGDCWFDHSGGCQEHGYLDLTPEQECPHSEAKRLLAARAARRDEEKR